ncbi:MAG: glycosyltransferase [Burkholderiales bacterium]|nr:glycosyltransferase [Burkholderiales bacterium]MCZ2135900.1 glycosyltransferase [Burkholderiales bacterium]
MITALFIAFLASFATALLLVLTTRWHARFSADAPGSGPQKLHERPTPRVGGIAIMVGFALAVAVARVQLPSDRIADAPPWLTGWLILALFVPFAAGLLEDLTKKIGAKLRLLATFIGAAIAYAFCGAALTRFDVAPLDTLIATVPLAPFVLTLFCVGAIANACNLADGLNGLLAGLALCACAAMGWVAWQHHDVFLALSLASLAAATAGFAIFNYPRARLFSGDGGAYLLGAAISIFAILLVRRHADVSPWFVFALVLYPFTDTTAAIVRRLVRRRPIMEPDAEHLHTLLARRLGAALGAHGPNLASAFIVLTAAGVAAIAFTLQRNTPALIALCSVVALLYALAYRLLRPAVASATGDAALADAGNAANAANAK